MARVDEKNAMGLLRVTDVPSHAYDLVFRESRAGNLIFGALFGAAAPAATALLCTPLGPALGVPAPGWCATVPILGFAWLFAWIGLFVARAAFAPTNWLVRVTRDRLYIKFRSYLNAHFDPADPVVIEVPLDAVEWVRKASAHRTVAARGHSTSQSTTTETVEHLDIKVRSLDPVAVREALAEERKRRPSDGRGGTKVVAKHYPVSLAEDDVVRVLWRSRNTKVRPTIDRAVALLGERLNTTAVEATHQDEPSSREAMERQIVAMVEEGQTMGAAALASQLYGFDTTEAVQFVDSLQG